MHAEIPKHSRTSDDIEEVKKNHKTFIQILAMLIYYLVADGIKQYMENHTRFVYVYFISVSRSRVKKKAVFR